MSNILLRLALPYIRQTFSWNFEMNIFPIEQDYCVYSSVTFQCIENIFKKNHIQKKKKNGEKARNQMITAYKKNLGSFHYMKYSIEYDTETAFNQFLDIEFFAQSSKLIQRLFTYRISYEWISNQNAVNVIRLCGNCLNQ